ncbi:Cell division protein ZapD [hydrothermal vent metagenome]|uniref:Cell division protein ZapD n=1 Tax=hydrothermal vent metagenome TaxID=652676 RepID=A0A3B1BR20_9ZZZZ
MTNQIIYEHPLNERIRTLLRLEHLFQRIAFHLSQPDAWSSRAAINGLLDIISILTRSDIRSEVTKELERYTTNLGKIRSTQGIDIQHLDEIMRNLEANMENLHKTSTQVGRDLREDSFLNSIVQRSSIPGGNCAFDLPHYHYWLQQPPEARLKDLQNWFCELEPLQKATQLLLSLTRDSTRSTNERANAGLFKYTLEAQTPAQLVCIGLSMESRVFPVISGGKHRFAIRFLEPNMVGKATQTKRDVEFSLICCTF